MKKKTNFSKKEIDLAGVEFKNKEVSSQSLKVVDDFRASHIHAMYVFRMNLSKKLQKCDFKDFLLSQRLKRSSSIKLKLSLQKTMNLSQMQDIAGLRVVLDNKKDVYCLRETIRKGDQEVAFKSEFKSEKDYIATPKDTGYRSLHLVYKYGKKLDKNEQFFVEIQIRTKIQHAWATAVEVLGTFLRQPLKQNKGEDRYLELLKDISKCFIMIEDNISDKEIFKQTSYKIENLQILDRLRGFSKVTELIDKNNDSKSKYYLIVLDFNKKTLSVKGFIESKFDNANEAYVAKEKEHINDVSYEVVLVSVDNINLLKKTYPNYFLDTGEFIKYIEQIKTLSN